MFKHYKFIDYATQGYLLFVAVLILAFHNGTVPGWQWLLGAHLVCLVGVHALIVRHARGGAGKVLSFFRHFYPLLLYTGMFRETGSLNRMFFIDYMDPLVIRWEQALFGCQPSILFMEKLPYVWVSELFYIAYFSYYVMIAGVGIALFIRNRAQFFHFVSVISFVFYICYAIYIVLPVVGPRLFIREIDGYALRLSSPVCSTTSWRSSTRSSRRPARPCPAATWRSPCARCISRSVTCPGSGMRTWSSRCSSARPRSIAATTTWWMLSEE